VGPRASLRWPDLTFKLQTLRRLLPPDGDLLDRLATHARPRQSGRQRMHLQASAAASSLQTVRSSMTHCSDATSLPAHSS